MDEVAEAIDFDPARIGDIHYEDGRIVFNFPAQPCYARSNGERPSLIPLYRCQIVLSAAKMSHLADELPAEFNEFEVNFPGGSRGFFLPIGFDETGPVQISFGCNGSKNITAIGARIQLVVCEQTDVLELWPGA